LTFWFKPQLIGVNCFCFNRHAPRVIAFPSAALPASGSLGIISARYIKAPLILSVLRKDEQSYVPKNLICKRPCEYFPSLFRKKAFISGIANFKTMYKAIIKENNYEIVPGEHGYRVNGEDVQLDIASIGENYFHVIFKDKSYRAEIVKADRATKTFKVKINGSLYELQLKNKVDLLLEKMGMQNGASGKINSIKAPMPGLIIDLKVKEGDTVKQNDPLLILEAMKMENIIKAPGDGIVKHVKVKKGNSVEKNQVLIEF
jgi:biotin carboxyl carrier protein